MPEWNYMRIFRSYSDIKSFVLCIRHCTKSCCTDDVTFSIGISHTMGISAHLYLLSLFSVGCADILFGGDLDLGSTCHRCPPGYGVTRMCDQDKLLDTACLECGTGTFNERYTITDPCQPCSKCPLLFYAMRPCSRIKDTACLPCWNKNEGAAFGNEDYLQKCESQTIPTATIKTTYFDLPIDIGWTPDPQEDNSEEPAKSELDKKPKTPSLPEASERNVTRKPTTTAKAFPVPTVFTIAPQETTENETVPLLLMSETETTTGSFQWQVLVAVLAGSAAVFIIGVIIAVCLRRDKSNTQGEYKLSDDRADVDGDFDEPDASAKILTPSGGSTPGDIDDVTYDSRSPLCQAPLVTHGQHLNGEPLPRKGASFADPSHPSSLPMGGATGPETKVDPQNIPSQNTGVVGARVTPPNPRGLSGAYQPQNTPLAGVPALSELGPGVFGDELPTRVPPVNSVNPPAVKQKIPIESPLNGTAPIKVVDQPDIKPTVPRYSTPALYNKDRRPAKRRQRPRRGQGSFNRNLHYIDEDSDDEVVQHAGRPPSVSYTDRWGRGLIRQVSDMWDRLRNRSRRSSNASQQSPNKSSRPVSQASFDLDDSRMNMTLDTTYDYRPDTTMDMTFDYLNATGMSADFHNITGISELTVTDNKNRTGLQFEVHDTDV